MKIFDSIKEEVSKLDHLGQQEKIDLPYLIMYYISKVAPYFEDRYDILRLAEVDDFDFNNKLSFGHLKVNSMRMHTNQHSESFIIGDYKGQTNKEYMINDHDIDVLKSAYNAIEKSKDLDELVINIELLTLENKEFLYHYMYMIRDKQEILGNRSTDIITDIVGYLNKDKNQNDELEFKYRTKIYFDTFYDKVESNLPYYIKEAIKHPFKIDLIEKHLNEDKINKVKLDPNNLEVILVENRKKTKTELKKILYNKLYFRQNKFSTKMIINNKLESLNENVMLKRYKKEIKDVYSNIKTKYPLLLDTNEKYNLIYHKKEEEESFNMTKNIPIEQWCLDYWDKDKSLAGYEYSSAYSIEEKTKYESNYIYVNNSLENVAFVKFYVRNDKLSIEAIDCGKKDKKIITEVLNYIMNYSLENKIALIHIDLFGSIKNSLNDFKNDVLLDFIKDNKTDIVFYESAMELCEQNKAILFFEKYGLYGVENSNMNFSEQFDLKTRRKIKNDYIEILKPSIEKFNIEDNKSKKKKGRLCL